MNHQQHVAILGIPQNDFMWSLLEDTFDVRVFKSYTASNC